MRIIWLGDTEEEMIVERPESCFKKHFKFIIILLIICSLIILGALSFILFKIFWKKENKPQGSESIKPSFGLSMEELERERMKNI